MAPLIARVLGEKFGDTGNNQAMEISRHVGVQCRYFSWNQCRLKIMGVQSFLKVQAASVAGSMADYLLTIILVSGFHWGYVLASVSGNILGAATLFVLCRKWIFRPDKGRLRVQILRFILVFAGNIILAAIGIYLLTHFLHIHYIISKTIVSVLLGVSYNYLMQKRFVFV